MVIDKMMTVTGTIFSTKHVHFPALPSQSCASVTSLMAIQSSTHTRYSNKWNLCYAVSFTSYLYGLDARSWYC